MKQQTSCFLRTCFHKSAYKWIQCGDCEGWYHCCCVGVRASDAKLDSFSFTCDRCA